MGVIKMLDEFLTSVEVLISPNEKEWVAGENEFSGEWVETKPAEYHTQVIIAQRPETKTQSDLDRVINLGKPQAVIDKFTILVNLGIAWDYCDAYIYWLNDIDTCEKWASVITYDEDEVEISRTEKPESPIEPVRQPDVVNNYARTIFKANRAVKVAALTVEVDGMIFDADETSQIRMVSSVASMDDDETQLWVLADNSVAYLTKKQLRRASKQARIDTTSMWTS
jgi:hypothetical protein